MLELDKIYNMDCLDGMKQIDDDSIDLIITDPPYGITTDKKDYLAITFISDCYRILKNNSAIFCFVGQKTLPYFFLEFEKNKFIWQNTIIWHYKNSIKREKKRFVIQYDPILFFIKGEFSINANDIRVPLTKKSKERLKNKVGGKIHHYKQALCGDVWEIPCITSKAFSKEKLEHNWQKPEKVINRIIKASTNENDIVLDCFSGSGTIPYCCRKLNRHYLGFEINEEYYNISLQRLLNVPERLEKWIDSMN